MFKHLIEQMPPDPSGVVITLVVAVGIGLGAITALLGALHSRPTMSLMMLSIGALGGFLLPSWFGWDVNTSATITTGAIVFGLLGFILHRYCVAFALGVLISLVAVFVLYDQTQPADIPVEPTAAVQTEQTLPQTAYTTWDQATPKFKSMAPWLALAAFGISGVLAMVFPKFGMALLYSLGGTLLTLFCIKLGHNSDKIHWLDSLKTGPMTIAALGMTMVLVGFLTQIALLYRPAPGQPEESRSPSEMT